MNPEEEQKYRAEIQEVLIMSFNLQDDLLSVDSMVLLKNYDVHLAVNLMAVLFQN